MLTLKEKTMLISEKLICSPEQNILIIPFFLTYTCYNSLQISQSASPKAWLYFCILEDTLRSCPYTQTFNDSPSAQN